MHASAGAAHVRRPGNNLPHAAGHDAAHVRPCQSAHAPTGTSTNGGDVSVDDPVVLTCAISGVLANRVPRSRPAIPYTPAEYAAEARRIVDEGA